jgi:hypothetical protein
MCSWCVAELFHAFSQLTQQQLSLFTADLLQSLGVVMDVRWINDGIVHVGSLCTAQGKPVLQFANILTFPRCPAEYRPGGNCHDDFCTLQLTVNLSDLTPTMQIITVNTFDSIWRRGGVTLKWASILVGIVWTFLVLTVTISTSVHKKPPFYAPTPVCTLPMVPDSALAFVQYWCWINSSYPNYRIALENFWLWIGFAVSVLYIPLFFLDRGRVTPGDPEWWRFTLHTGDATKGDRRSKMIMYAPS